MVSINKKFRVRTEHFGEKRLWEEIRADCMGAAAARVFRSMNVGLVGEVYTNMCDMPIDEHRLLRATGKLLIRSEVEEIEEAYHRVIKSQLEDMCRQFRQMYEVDKTVTNEHLKFSAQIAVAYEKVILKHDISAFGFYWWGEKN